MSRGSSIQNLPHDGDMRVVPLPGDQYSEENNLQVSNPISTTIQLMDGEEEVSSWTSAVDECVHLDSRYTLRFTMPDEDDGENPPPVTRFNIQVTSP